MSSRGWSSRATKVSLAGMDDDAVWPVLIPFIAALAAFFAGLAVWVALSLQGGLHEAWDRSNWWVFGIPFLAVVAVLCGYAAPARVWRWSSLIVLGHFVGVALVHPPGAGLGLLPLALVFIALPMVVGLTVLALLGGALRRGWDRGVVARS